LTAGTRLYRAAARLVAPILCAPGVRSVYIRRSVAYGEADFPWSDLDLGLVVEGFGGREMNGLRRRLLAARVAFPRLGECQIASADELTDLAHSDPYRASLDRRFGVTVAGDPPPIPVVPVSRRAAARRLVHWFERYLPRAVRQGNLRNQRKFVLEMWNALGVIEGEWAEPLATRRETAARAREIGLTGCGEPGGTPFALCCRIAARAEQQLLPPAPATGETVVLSGENPLVLLPVESAPWPAPACRGAGIVATPAVLQLMLETHSPFLWLRHGPALRDLGFAPPSRQSWAEACVRLTGGDRLRGPGFHERGPNAHPAILGPVERVLEMLESGELPEGPLKVAVPPGYSSVAAYYRDGFDRLSEVAARLHCRSKQILAGWAIDGGMG
jgi:hypothetical protein